MCIIINIIYTYNINSMPPKRNTKKYTTPTSRRRDMQSQWAADNPNPGIINGITTNPPQQPSQIPTTNVQVAEPPTHAPPTGDGVTTPNTIPVTSIPTESPIPGGSPSKGNIGYQRPKKGQTAKKPGKKKLTTDEERERRFNALIRRHQQNADNSGYSMGAIDNRVIYPPPPPRQGPLPPPQQNENTFGSLFPELNNIKLNNINNTNGGKRRNSVKRRKSVKRKTHSKRQRGGSKEEEEKVTAELMTASVHGHTDTVEKLLRDGADVNGKDKRFGRTALMSAMYRGHTHIVKLLLENGADVNAEDKDGTTALCLAIFYKHTDIEELLNEVIKSGEKVRCHIEEVIEQRKKEQNTKTDNIPPLSVFAAASLTDEDRQKLHRESLDIDEKTGKIIIGGKRKTRKSKRNSRSKRQRGGRKRTVKKNKSKGKKTRNN
jgi:hypothetical protein